MNAYINDAYIVNGNTIMTTGDYKGKTFKYLKYKEKSYCKRILNSHNIKKDIYFKFIDYLQNNDDGTYEQHYKNYYDKLKEEFRIINEQDEKVYLEKRKVLYKTFGTKFKIIKKIVDEEEKNFYRYFLHIHKIDEIIINNLQNNMYEVIFKNPNIKDNNICILDH